MEPAAASQGFALWSRSRPATLRWASGAHMRTHRDRRCRPAEGETLAEDAGDNTQIVLGRALTSRGIICAQAAESECWVGKRAVVVLAVGGVVFGGAAVGGRALIGQAWYLRLGKPAATLAIGGRARGNAAKKLFARSEFRPPHLKRQRLLLPTVQRLAAPPEGSLRNTPPPKKMRPDQAQDRPARRETSQARPALTKNHTRPASHAVTGSTGPQTQESEIFSFRAVMATAQGQARLRPDLMAIAPTAAAESETNLPQTRSPAVARPCLSRRPLSTSTRAAPCHERAKEGDGGEPQAPHHASTTLRRAGRHDSSTPGSILHTVHTHQLALRHCQALPTHLFRHRARTTLAM